MPYEKCGEVNQEFWQELRGLDPGEVTARTGASFGEGRYRLPFFHRVLVLDPGRGLVRVAGAEAVDPGFKACLTALLYLARIDPAVLGGMVSPLELPGGPTFFRGGPHGLPHGPLEERFGNDLAAFQAAGARLQAQPRAAGDAALAFQVFPGLGLEVILWLADDEFPAKASFTVPAHLDRFWHLDAVLGLLILTVEELLAAASS